MYYNTKHVVMCMIGKTFSMIHNIFVIYLFLLHILSIYVGSLVVLNGRNI